ncbi:MAG: MoxR family ATPase [Campylobacterales bacterium]|nr:MoxR family ATPase [Campylobacterales bacterium]
MRSKEITETLGALIDQKLPTFLWGAPGIGKSSVVKQIAEAKGMGFIDLRLSLMDPTDLKGIPFYENQVHQAVWAPPSFLPREGSGILFLDELNTAAPSVQASAYQLILDRKVGEYELPEGWAIVAAGNRENDRGVVYRMPLPLANRFIHLEMDVNVDDWRRWAYGRGIDERIIGYISANNAALFGFDPASDTKSFPTPRSWEFVNGILASGMRDQLALNAIAGAIGEEHAVNFMAFAKVMHLLPDTDALLRGESHEVPEDLSALYALASALVAKVLKAPDDETLARLLDYTHLLPPEFAVLIVQDLQKNGVMMDHLDAYGKWVGKFAFLLQ